MKTLNEVVEDIKKIETTLKDFEEEVIVTFGDYEYNGTSEVFIEKVLGQNYDYITYINAKNSIEIYISTEKVENVITVRDAWTNEKEEKLKKDVKRIKNSLYKYFTKKNLYRCFFELGKVQGLDLLSCKQEKDCYVFIFKHEKTLGIEYTVLVSKESKEVIILYN